MGLVFMCCHFSNLHAVICLLFCTVFRLDLLMLTDEESRVMAVKLVMLHNHFFSLLVLDMTGKGKLCVCKTGCSLFSTHYKQSVGHLILSWLVKRNLLMKCRLHRAIMKELVTQAHTEANDDRCHFKKSHALWWDINTFVSFFFFYFSFFEPKTKGLSTKFP